MSKKIKKKDIRKWARQINRGIKKLQKGEGNLEHIIQEISDKLGGGSCNHECSCHHNKEPKLHKVKDKDVTAEFRLKQAQKLAYALTRTNFREDGRPVRLSSLSFCIQNENYESETRISFTFNFDGVISLLITASDSEDSHFFDKTETQLFAYSGRNFHVWSTLIMPFINERPEFADIIERSGIGESVKDFAFITEADAKNIVDGEFFLRKAKLFELNEGEPVTADNLETKAETSYYYYSVGKKGDPDEKCYVEAVFSAGWYSEKECISNYDIMDTVYKSLQFEDESGQRYKPVMVQFNTKIAQPAPEGEKQHIANTRISYSRDAWVNIDVDECFGEKTFLDGNAQEFIDRVNTAHIEFQRVLPIGKYVNPFAMFAFCIENSCEMIESEDELHDDIGVIHESLGTCMFDTIENRDKTTRSATMQLYKNPIIDCEAYIELELIKADESKETTNENVNKEDNSNE